MPLLADAEAGKITPSKSSALNSPVISFKRVLRQAQFLGQQVERLGLAREMRRGFHQVGVDAAQRVQVAFARDEHAFGCGL